MRDAGAAVVAVAATVLRTQVHGGLGGQPGGRQVAELRRVVVAEAHRVARQRQAAGAHHAGPGDGRQ